MGSLYNVCSPITMAAHISGGMDSIDIYNYSFLMHDDFIDHMII